MKPMKVAAVVAGSVMALGAATPAFATDAIGPMSLNGALDTIANQGLRDAKPLHTNALDTENEGSLVNAVSDAANGLNKSGKGGSLLGGLPLGK
jgi:hypothetical protein